MILGDDPQRSSSRVLVACVGNVLFGDDGFGVEVARRLAARRPPEGVRVVDFGIRSFDLSFALLEGCSVAILVDAMRRGGSPGSLYVLEPETPAAEAPLMLDTHAMHPASVLAYVRALGGELEALRIVGCEPLVVADEEAPCIGLSAPVAAAVEPACVLVEDLCRAALRGELRA